MTSYCKCGHIKSLHRTFHYHLAKRISYGKCTQCECKEFNIELNKKEAEEK